ncbi:MAG TPA: CDP-alcohol phosphatidyltransferase family protein [Bryobacteraceae bacterium]|nr:CDP-alcohol phosphatidyltransferase family protein [Bryobacteraceae bacterium]
MRPENVSTVPSSREKTTWRTLPNLLTAMRIALIAPFGWLCMRGYDISALSVFLFAGVTDTVDGTLARRFNQSSKFGRLADPLADKLLTTVAFLTLCLRTGLSTIPVWVTVAVISRDVLILTGSLVVYTRTRSTAFKPNAFGKANTFIEISVIVVFLASSRLVYMQHRLIDTYILLLVFLIVSICDYLLQGLRMLRNRN